MHSKGVVVDSFVVSRQIGQSTSPSATTTISMFIQSGIDVISLSLLTLSTVHLIFEMNTFQAHGVLGRFKFVP